MNNIEDLPLKIGIVSVQGCVRKMSPKFQNFVLRYFREENQLRFVALVRNRENDDPEALAHVVDEAERVGKDQARYFLKSIGKNRWEQTKKGFANFVKKFSEKAKKLPVWALERSKVAKAHLIHKSRKNASEAIRMKKYGLSEHEREENKKRLADLFANPSKKVVME